MANMSCKTCIGVICAVIALWALICLFAIGLYFGMDFVFAAF
jgi:hypothetical protein